MSSSPQLSGFRPILRLAGFRQLWMSQLLALTAQNGIFFVQLVLVERLTGRSLDIGVMVMSFSLPPVIFSFLAGVVIDRVPKKWIIVASNLVRGLLALSYIFLIDLLSGRTLLLAVYAVTFLGSAVGAFFNPAVLAKLPLVAGERRLIVANSLFNITIAGSQLLGLIVLAPVAVKVLGVPGAFGLFGGFYLLAFLLVLRLPRDPGRRVRGITAAGGWQRLRGEIRAGVAFIGHNRTVYMALLQLTLVTTLIMILAMLAPGFSARVLGLAAEDAVLVFAPAGVGMFFALIFLGRWGVRLPQTWLQSSMLLLTAAGFAILGFISRDYNRLLIPILEVYPQRLIPLSTMVAATAAVLGFGMYAVNTLGQTALQRYTPPQLRGRIFTVQFMLTNLVGLIPLLAAATLADLLGIPLLLRWLAFASLVVAAMTLYSAIRPQSVVFEGGKET